MAKRGKKVAKKRAKTLAKRRGRALTIPDTALGGLTSQRRDFVLRYCGLKGQPRERWNGTQAAIGAGYSKNSARAQAHDLLRDDRVMAAVAEICDHLESLAYARWQRALDEIEAVALARLTDLVDLDSFPAKLRDDAPPEVLAALLEVTDKVGPDGTHERRIKMHSKTQALALFLKALDARPPALRRQGATAPPRPRADNEGPGEREGPRRMLGILGVVPTTAREAAE